MPDTPIVGVVGACPLPEDQVCPRVIRMERAALDAFQQLRSDLTKYAADLDEARSDDRETRLEMRRLNRELVDELRKTQDELRRWQSRVVELEADGEETLRDTRLAKERASRAEVAVELVQEQVTQGLGISRVARKSIAPVAGGVIVALLEVLRLWLAR